MDDITIGGPPSSVANDVNLIETIGLNTLGLQLNITKCELITKSDLPSIKPIDQFIHISASKAFLLGAPLSDTSAMSTILSEKLRDLQRAAGRLTSVAAHDALILLRASVGAPKLMHVLRSSPCTDHAILCDIDSVLRQCLCDIVNVNLSDDHWKQASLPVKSGGLGIRSTSAIASSAFLASESSTQQLQSKLLDKCSFATPDHHFTRLREEWMLSHPSSSPPSGLLACKQRSWDNFAVTSAYNELLTSQPNDYHKARLLAASAHHSGDWLHALPISACGLRLDDNAIRIAVGLRLGAIICEPHHCVCGSLVCAKGYHGLSCKRSAGRMPRHNYINDIIYHTLVNAGLPSTKEPAGLLRTDGKRPDGLTSVPWQSGKTAVWDVTVIDTMATSYVDSTSATPGSAAEIAAARKELKYTELASSHIFIPLAFETLGPIGSKASLFLRQLGHRLSLKTGDKRETAFLFQRLSIALQRFNAVCVMGTFPADATVCARNTFASLLDESD
jgi:hypothetical protein